MSTIDERQLCDALGQIPHRHNYRYTEQTERDLRQLLCRALVANDPEHLSLLFNGSIPNPQDPWRVSVAQGQTEGMEYSEAARGKPCGHIFKAGHLSFRCKTCSDDDTAALCMRCFEASDHRGHVVHRSISSGNTGCCDCGDEEAWKRDINCNIHSASEVSPPPTSQPSLPAEISQAITSTIERALDFVIDVISCSPENLRLPRTEESVKQDEQQSRLTSVWYNDRATPFAEYALVLWNDEKHTIVEVENQVARACKQRRSFGRQKANETNDYGRSVIEYSTDLPLLLKMATIIEQIKITVTVRSSRDTFREQMCGSIIDWLNDLVGCSLGAHLDCFRQCLCVQLLRPWQQGSRAIHKEVVPTQLDDHEIEDHDDNNSFPRRHALQHLIIRAQQQEDDAESDDEMMDLDDEDVATRFDVVPQETVVPVPLESLLRDISGRPDNSEHAQLMAQNSPETSDRRSPNADSLPQTTVELLPSPTMQLPPHLPNTQRINTHLSSTPNHTGFPVPSYWLHTPQAYGNSEPIPVEEDLRRRLRLDWLLLYDLRLWKTIRVALRDLYITTLVSQPSTKRVFGLRFAGLYNMLGQLFLIADREPDLSIVSLSLQFLTTPSITQEVIEKANFLTTVFSMLFTFLTQRNVHHPWEVSTSDSTSQVAISNRRTLHFFYDIRYLLTANYVQQQLRTCTHYQLQFLDLLRLPQGICPNTRAVTEHVEFENDNWLSAQILTKEINRLCRQFGEAFQPGTDLMAALRTVAYASVINSMGGDRARFPHAEIKAEARFRPALDNTTQVIDFEVANEPMSFHHPLHYTLSWLLERCKTIPKDEVLRALYFSKLSNDPPIAEQRPEEYLLAVFDVPVRVLAWLAQMRVGMWVRNGLSLRHQMANYRSASQRDFGYHRDLFLLQASFVLFDPTTVLANMISRFGLDDWMRGVYEGEHAIELAEEFLHLLVVCLCERTSLQVYATAEDEHRCRIRREIIHILCFKELAFSELDAKFGDRVLALDDYQDVLETVSHYRPPEGMSDSGTFALRREVIGELDPYFTYYNRNQRDEAESIWRDWSGLAVFEPNLPPLSQGLFSELPALVASPLFVQTLFYSLNVGLRMTCSRLESYLHVVLHLLLVALLADERLEDKILTQPSELGITVFDLLNELYERKRCQSQIRHILTRLETRQPLLYAKARELYIRFSGHNAVADKPADSTPDMKKLAMERQARVMAQFKEQQIAFLANQSSSDDGEVNLEESARCILCQEETNDSMIYGTFGLLANSTVFRVTDTNNAAAMAEIAAIPESLDREGPRSGGFESTTFVRSHGPVSTGCGHIMHHRCFERFYVATGQRQQMQIARQHPERLDLKEFVCPLCKALGNAFLPLIWSPRAAKPLGEKQCPEIIKDSGLGSAVRFLKSPGRRLNADHVAEIARVYLDPTMMQSLKQPRVKHLHSFGIDDELYAAYARLRVTLLVNKLASDRGNILQVLLRLLTGSITSVEIAQRGVASAGIFIDTVPSVSLEHLRVLCETSKSMIAAALVRFHDLGITSSVCYHFVDRCLTQVFVGHPQLDIGEDQLREEYSPEPALMCDSFEILVQSSILLVPILRIDLHSMVLLCYLLETVRAVVFVHATNTASANDGPILRMWEEEAEEPAGGVDYSLVSRFVLVFLRKAALLLHVSEQTELPAKEGSNEMERLCRAMDLPTPDQVQEILNPVLEAIVRGWMRHLLLYRRLRRDQCGRPNFVLDVMRLGYPGVYELIKLPSSFDKLAYEITLRKCKTTGGALVDASLCLFCGAFLCSQALCCSDQSEGGCNLHMERCGRGVGLFLNVRKCMVLYLHNGRGSWNTAPYLDKFGEADPCFRHGRQLILSQKRYDKLYREVWLQHGIPSYIARRLDADMNNGGWETL